MHCLRHALLFAIIIPMPSASPLFLLIFSLAAYWVIRPCGYCMVLLAILFFSTAPSSPFMSVLTDAPAPPPPTPSVSVPYDTNIPERGAFFLNGGQIFDPVLVGYREMQRVWRETLAGDAEGDTGSSESPAPEAVSPAPPAESPAPQAESPAAAPAVPPPAVGAAAHKGLPAGYVDLRIGGVGVVLDLGWARTDEGLRWEVENVRQAADAKRSRRAVREQRGGGASASPAPAPAGDAADGSGWLRSPFVGMW